MSAALDVAFNLLANAGGSFLVAVVLGQVALWVLRPRDGAWKQLFLGIPLLKIAFDLARGIPSDAFFWQRLAGAPRDFETLRARAGWGAGVPILDLGLGAFHGGLRRSQSFAEPLATVIARLFGSAGPRVLAAAILVVSFALLVRRARRALVSLLEAARLRRSAVVIDRRSLGLRVVDIVVSREHAGAPFVSGLVAPFVCFSRDVIDALTDEEREAVMGHELAHLARHDMLLFAAVALFADVLWFVPGLRTRCRAICAQAELAADRSALSSGSRATSLASALLRVAEHRAGSPVFPLSFHRGESLLSHRIRSLLSLEQIETASSTRLVARLLGAAWVVAVILRASMFGNH